MVCNNLFEEVMNNSNVFLPFTMLWLKEGNKSLICTSVCDIKMYYIHYVVLTMSSNEFFTCAQAGTIFVVITEKSCVRGIY